MELLSELSKLAGDRGMEHFSAGNQSREVALQW